MNNSINKLQNDFWNKAAFNKEFNDPFYLKQLKHHIKTDSLIIEYGCGYGRLLNLLHENGFHNIKGFDFSQSMIDKGIYLYPHLDLQLINHAILPVKNEIMDAAILSTVLCCVPDNLAQEQIIQEIDRVLKPNAVLYLTDFLITDTEHMTKKYQKDFHAYNEWGTYQTTEGAIVRHYTPTRIMELLNTFMVHWYHEEDFVTMNNNSVKTFHGIYQKIG